MKKITLSAIGVAATVLLGACASGPGPVPPELAQARDAVSTAQSNPQVLSSAPVELKRATDALSRANALYNDRQSPAEIASASYVAQRKAQTAVEVARAKQNDDAIRGAELERERVRADASAAAARRAQGQAAAATAQAGQAQARASSAEAQAAAAQASAASAQQQAAALQQQLDQLKAKSTDRGMLVTLGDVLFETGRAEVRPSAQADLGRLAAFLRAHPERRVLVEGFTDSTGGADFNLTLSKRRADAVRAALVGLGGVDASRIDTIGYGKDYPVADNGSATNRALNRRVEVYISNDDRPVQPRRG